jgi:hypothetical protein
MQSNMIDGQKRGFMQFQYVRAFLDSILDEDIHTKRVDLLTIHQFSMLAIEVVRAGRLEGF